MNHESECYPVMGVWIVEFFDAAHRLPDEEWLHSKKCCNLHGHTYKAEVEIYTCRDVADVVIDFGAIKNVLRQLDHAYLNDEFGKTPGFEGRPTTAENTVLLIVRRIRDILPEGARIREIRLYEGWKGDGSSAVVYEP